MNKSFSDKCNRALVFHGPYEMSLKEIEMPVAGIGEVVVRVRAVGMCGSDIHGFSGKTGRRTPGMVMGHEVAGEVAWIGEKVRGLVPGQKVVIQPIFFCGQCFLCREGKTSLCLKKRMLGVNMGAVGGLSDFVAVPTFNVYPLDPAVSFSIGCLAEALAVGESAVATAAIRNEETVAIIGAGMIGLAILLAAQTRRPKRVFMVDGIERRLALAETFGATPVNYRDSVAMQRIWRETGDLGADVVIEAVGVPSSVATAQKATRDGGRIVWIGNSAKTVEVDMQDLVVKGKSIQGVYCYTNDDFGRAVRYLEKNQSLLKNLVEKEVPLHEATDAFIKLAKGEWELLRGVVLMD